MKNTDEPKPLLTPGTIYEGDNGRLMCSHVHCAGMTALYTGKDRSGQKLSFIPRSEDAEWFATFGRHMTCECGRTSYAPTK